MKYDEENLPILHTGRKIYAYDGVIGINRDSTYVGGGWDDEIDWKLMRDKFYNGELSDNTTKDEFLDPKERIELACEMIRRWEAYQKEAVEELNRG